MKGRRKRLEFSRKNLDRKQRGRLNCRDRLRSENKRDWPKKLKTRGSLKPDA
jgi:hypothetical protein